ncbi:MAG: AI-2E family transporter [Fimbriimonadaceae bacterium]|nr:AI-2E family transporter [Fimbriimonadaceae bacterium]
MSGGLKYDDSNIRVVFWLIAGVVLLLGGVMLAPFLGAIMWAAVLAVLMHPLYLRFKRARIWPFLTNALRGKKWADLREKLAEVGAAFTTTLVALLIIMLPVLGIGTAVGLEVYEAVGSSNLQQVASPSELTLAGVAAEVDKAVEPTLRNIPVEAVQKFRLADFLAENQEAIQEAVVGPAQTGLRKFGVAVFSAIVALLTFFFMLMDGHRLLQPALDLIPLPHEEGMKLLVRLRETVWSVFMGVVFVAIIQGTLAGIAYAVLGVPSPLLWGVATIFFAMIPLVGPPVIFVPLALLLFVQGKTGEAIGLVAFGALVISQVDNILRPFFIGARTSLHPMAVFFSLIGGVLMMGPIGLMAGPIILTLCLVVGEILILRRRLAEGRPAGDPKLAPEPEA